MRGAVKMIDKIGRGLGVVLLWSLVATLFLIALAIALQGDWSDFVELADLRSWKIVLMDPRMDLLRWAIGILAGGLIVMHFRTRWKWRKMGKGELVAGLVIALCVAGLMTCFLQAAERRKALYKLSNGGDWRVFEELFEAGEYQRLAAILDSDSLAWSAAIEEHGGIGSFEIAEITRHHRATANGMGAIYCHFHSCADFNAKHAPSGVEKFMGMRAYEAFWDVKRGSYLSPEWQVLSRHLSSAKHPHLKAYGLWFCGNYVEYRKFVRECFEAGDASMEGFFEHTEKYQNWPFASLDYDLSYSVDRQLEFERGDFDEAILRDAGHWAGKRGRILPDRYHPLVTVVAKRYLARVRQFEREYRRNSYIEDAISYVGMEDEVLRLHEEVAERRKSR
jgi:hypothetical protein